MSSSDAKRTQHYRSVMPLAPSNSFAIFFFGLFVWSTAPLSRPDNLQPHHRISSILTSNHESPLLLPQVIWTALSLWMRKCFATAGTDLTGALRERETETRREEKRTRTLLRSGFGPLKGTQIIDPVVCLHDCVSSCRWISTVSIYWQICPVQPGVFSFLKFCDVSGHGHHHHPSTRGNEPNLATAQTGE